MSEPEWVNGDDFARGVVTECPECGEIALRDDVCEECGADYNDPFYDPFDYHDDPLEW